jgi:hypothetical protein
MSEWKVIGKWGDPCLLGQITDVKVQNEETGKTEEFTIQSGTPKEEAERIGERIAEGFDNDD